jgi:hypothetical protein
MKTKIFKKVKTAYDVAFTTHDPSVIYLAHIVYCLQQQLKETGSVSCGAAVIYYLYSDEVKTLNIAKAQNDEFLIKCASSNLEVLNKLV